MSGFTITKQKCPSVCILPKVKFPQGNSLGICRTKEFLLCIMLHPELIALNKENVANRPD